MHATWVSHEAVRKLPKMFQTGAVLSYSPNTGVGVFIKHFFYRSERYKLVYLLFGAFYLNLCAKLMLNTRTFALHLQLGLDINALWAKMHEKT